MADVRFTTVETYFGDATVPAAERVARALPPLPMFLGPLTATDSPAVTARLEQARWIADCGVCGGAELLARTDPRFICCNPLCPLFKTARPVVWPPDVEGIESTLSAIPADLDQLLNWNPGETVDELAAQVTDLVAASAPPEV